MLDIAYVALTVLFFALMLAYVPEWATGSGSIDEGGERPCQPRGCVRVPAEKQMWLDQLQLHEHQATVPLHPIDPRVQRMARRRRHDRLGIRDQPGRWRQGRGRAPELPLHPVVRRSGPLPDRVAEPAAEENEGPLAGVARFVDERLHHHVPGSEQLLEPALVGEIGR